MRIVSNSSPLIAFYRIGRMNMLNELFDEILVPEGVSNELKSGQWGKYDWIKTRQVKDKNMVNLLSVDLDIGESEAIILALEEKADLLLMDEKAGRKVATYLGINVAGTVSLLVKLAKHGKIQIKDELDNLINNEFRLKKGIYETAIKEIEEWKQG